MIVAEVVVLLLFGTTTWLAQDRSPTRHEKRRNRLTVGALALSAAVVVSAAVGVALTWS
ncbi:hypothetical protein [Actinoplanes friuliensis]|jgi:hypothetical protein|uniref:hypothetical protein n=1 Tax=Actinoplanes friuliensis TaxID=196914 RepID=UPI0003FDE263|nr:hypothetical protein [Actinoplanes friuliensis]